MDFLKRTWAEIDLDALIHNFKLIKQNACGEVVAVVKADAYGHGAAVVAPLLAEAGASGFAVSNLDEAIELREAGIIKPILILGYTPPELAPSLAEHDIAQAVFSAEYAGALNSFAAKCNIKIKSHLKLDTGMGRIGFDCRTDELSGLEEIKSVISMHGLIFEGVFTHFAVADSTADADTEYTNAQYNRFKKAISELKNSGFQPKYCHCCNSAALLANQNMHMNLSRAGIILYGLTPDPNFPLPSEFKPVMEFKSVVSMIKSISAGDTISYGRTFKAPSDMVVATIPVGYADGYPRLLSGKGFVMICGKKAPIIGRVCMDQLVVDITNIPETTEGDEVVLFGKNLPVCELAELCSTINYELVCAVSRRVPRVYLRNGKPEKVVKYL